MGAPTEGAGEIYSEATGGGNVKRRIWVAAPRHRKQFEAIGGKPVQEGGGF